VDIDFQIDIKMFAAYLQDVLIKFPSPSWATPL